MNLNQQIDYMQAAANPFPLRASFRELEGGGYQCKMCGAKCMDQGKATDHLLEKHREMESRDFSEGRRKKLAKSGDAMPGGGFPIVNRGDLANAKRAIGRAKNPAAARAHINERAKALGAKPIGQMESGGPGSGRHKEIADHITIQKNHNQDFVQIARSLTDKFGISRDVAWKHINKWADSNPKPKKRMEGQTEFSPANRLQMPKKAGQNTTTQNPQYTGGFPQLQSYGTSEGVKKAWEVRERGRITELYPGSGKVNGVKTTYHNEGSGDDLYVKETARRARVESHTGNMGTGLRLSTVHDGTPATATKFLKDNYGIEHQRFGGAKEWGIKLEAEKAGCCEACNERARMEALGLKMHRPSMGHHSSGCGHTGFHKGAGYENKAAKMGHRLTLSAGVERGVLIRQRAGMRRKTGYSFRGYQSL